MDENAELPVSRRTVLGAAVVGAAGYATGASAEMTAGSPIPPAASVDGVIHVPARDIPAPQSISSAAQAYLNQLARMPTMTGVGDGKDVAALKKQVAAFDNAVGGYYAGMANKSNTKVQTQVMGGVTVYVATRSEASAAELRKVHLYIHGGAFVFGGGRSAMYQAQLEARRYGGTVVSVDYRMPPDHPYPAALDDCLAVYRALLKDHHPSAILVSGESAGGNLSAALMLKAHDEGLPKPGAVFLFTPATDMAVPGDSHQVNLYADVVLKPGGGTPANIYANGADLTNPYLSPLRGNLAEAFPPTYVRSGTRDLLLSDSARMHAALRKAGIETDLYVGEGMPHSGFPDSTPEQAEAIADTVRWLEKHWHA